MNGEKLPLILVTTSIQDDDKTLLNLEYSDSVIEAGGLPILVPYTVSDEALAEYVKMADGVLFTGGVDMAPSFYGEETKPTCGEIHQKRDDVEARLFRLAYQSKKPIMGICRGMQLVNVLMGGSLYQDMPTECPSDIAHRQTEKYIETHSVNVVPGTPLNELAGAERIGANSFHHQAAKRIGDGLAVMATADDGTIEALYAEDYPYMRLYQWHPERLRKIDDIHMALFCDFVKAAR